MNEISSYDPELYHATLTHSVFVRLQGSVIRLSKPNHNIARRATHNEPKPDVTYVSQKIYDLSSSKVSGLVSGGRSPGRSPDVGPPSKPPSRCTSCPRTWPGSASGIRSTPSASTWASKTTSCPKQRGTGRRAEGRSEARAPPGESSPSICSGGLGGRRRSGSSTSWQRPG